MVVHISIQVEYLIAVRNSIFSLKLDVGVDNHISIVHIIK